VWYVSHFSTFACQSLRGSLKRRRIYSPPLRRRRQCAKSSRVTLPPITTSHNGRRLTRHTHNASRRSGFAIGVGQFVAVGVNAVARLVTAACHRQRDGRKKGQRNFSDFRMVLDCCDQHTEVARKHNAELTECGAQLRIEA